jgi:hypothetical protein
MNVNFKRLLFLLTPTFLRKALKSLLNAISVALQSIREDIKRFFTDINYHISVTPQTWSLEKMLNDKCDPTLRRIKIGSATANPVFYFFNSGNDNMMFFPNFIYKNIGYEYDFIVTVPIELESATMTNRITALLNKYKLLTKTFKIEYV